MSHHASETRPGSLSRGTRSATIASANPATSPSSAEMAADNVGAQALGASALPPATSSTSNSSASSAPSTVSDRSAQNQRLNRPSVLPHSVSSPLRSTPSTPGAVPAAAAANQRIPPSLQAKLAALANRGAATQANPSNNGKPAAAPSDKAREQIHRTETAPSANTHATPSSAGAALGSRPPIGGGPPAMRPAAGVAMPPSLAAKMANLTMRNGRPAASTGDVPKAVPAAKAPIRRKPGLQLSQMGASAGPLGAGPSMPNNATDSAFANFGKIVDPSGKLRFANKAILHAKGVDFSNGSSFNINMDELELKDELGKGNYGTVRKAWHKPTKVLMAMKEIRLELDESKLNAIIMELDILHRAVHPNIVEFYGAFFIESCVYYCMEFMNGGSLDKLYTPNVGLPEGVLAFVTESIVQGLRFLKDELQVMHRDVKPTNVLVNDQGAVKICDFGVSGQLEKSLAKTNIGCQSYMAPERIKGESLGQLGTYTVSSDVWSLGLSVVELGMGTYPYPPETYSNVFAQLQAIVNGEPPTLPKDKYSELSQGFISKCLQRNAPDRWNYSQLLRHPWIVENKCKQEEVAEWIKSALAQRISARQASLENEQSSLNEQQTI